MAKFSPFFARTNMEKDYVPSGLKIIKPPKLTFRVDVEFDDKIFSQVKNDGIMIGDMNGAIEKVYAQTCATIKNKLTVFEKLFQGMIDKGTTQADLEKQLAGLNSAIKNDNDIAEKAGRLAVDGVWKKYQAKKAAYKTYGIKIAVNIIGAGAGLIVSIALMATSPFSGGAGAAFGIIGMFKAVVTIAGEIGKAAAEVEKALAELGKQIEFVDAAYDKHKALGKANEYTAVIVTQFLGVAQPNIKMIDGQMKTVEQKLNGIEIGCHEASKTLNTILDKQEVLQAEFFKEAQVRLAKQPGAKAKEDMKSIQNRLDGVILASRSQVMEQIGTVTQLHERWKEADTLAEGWRKKVDALVAMRGTDVKIFENLLYFIDLPLAALDGNGIATGAADLAKGLGSCAANMGYDKIKGAVLEKSLLA